MGRACSSIGQEDSLTTATIGFEGAARRVLSRGGRDTARAGARRTSRPARERCSARASRPTSGACWSIRRTTRRRPYTFNYRAGRARCSNPALQKDVDLLRKELGDGFGVTSRTLDDKHWTVAYLVDDGPVKHYLYDRKAKEADQAVHQPRRPAKAAAGEDAAARDQGARRPDAVSAT